MSNAYDKNSKLVVLSLINGEHVEEFQNFQKTWERFFRVEHIIDTPNNIAKYLDSSIGVLFLEASDYKKFNLEYYKVWQKNMPTFQYVVVSDTKKSSDVEIYRALSDQILYLDGETELVTWNTMAILRRFWNAYSNETTVIYREIIADFIEGKVYLNQNEVSLTGKEYEVLKVLIQNRGKFVTKHTLFQKVWNTNIGDISRTLDQVLMRLKIKIGPKYFDSKRFLGVKLE